MHSLHRRHLLIALLLLFTLAINASIAFFNIRRLANNERLVARTYLILSELENILSLTKDIDTAQSAFVLTGDEKTLKPFLTSESQLAVSLEILNRNIAEAEQKKNLPFLRSQVQNRLQAARNIIQLRRTKGVDEAKKLVLAKSGAHEAEQIGRYVALIQGREQDVLQERADESTQSAEDATRTFWIASGANLWLLLLVSGLLWRASKQNAQLETAYADLKRAESMRDGLSAMLVHDLRTPLTTLLGPLHMLQDGTLGSLEEQQREIVVMSLHSGERLLELVNELLDISKMEAGELKIQHENMDVAPLIGRAIKEVARLENADSPRLSSEIEPSCSVFGDGDLLLRVLINLLGNALKFTPENGKITLSAKKNDKDTLFAVRDTGEGIPSEDLNRIFDKFGQVETRKAGRKLSTGLGLTFCKLAVEAHGGRIWAESEVGQGSTFFFTVPLSSVE